MKDEEIRSLLTNRITSEEITLEYIAKVLNIKIKEEGRNRVATHHHA